MRSPAAAKETTTPPRPSHGPTSSAPCRENSRAASSPAASAPRLQTTRASAPSVCAQAATFAAWPPGAGVCDRDAVVSDHERALEVDDHIEQQVAESGQPHRKIVAWTTTVARAGSGRSLSAASSVPQERSRRAVSLAQARRRVAPARPGRVRGRAVLSRARRRGSPASARGRRARRLPGIADRAWRTARAASGRAAIRCPGADRSARRPPRGSRRAPRARVCTTPGARSQSSRRFRRPTPRRGRNRAVLTSRARPYEVDQSWLSGVELAQAAADSARGQHADGDRAQPTRTVALLRAAPLRLRRRRAGRRAAPASRRSRPPPIRGAEDRPGPRASAVSRGRAHGRRTPASRQARRRRGLRPGAALARERRGRPRLRRRRRRSRRASARARSGCLRPSCARAARADEGREQAQEEEPWNERRGARRRRDAARGARTRIRPRRPASRAGTARAASRPSRRAGRSSRGSSAALTRRFRPEREHALLAVAVLRDDAPTSAVGTARKPRAERQDQRVAGDPRPAREDRGPGSRWRPRRCPRRAESRRRRWRGSPRRAREHGAVRRATSAARIACARAAPGATRAASATVRSRRFMLAGEATRSALRATCGASLAPPCRSTSTSARTATSSK